MPIADGARAAVEAYVAALAAGDLDRLEMLVAADVVGHEPAGDIVGATTFRRHIAGWVEAFPEMHLRTDDLFASEDRVAWRWSLSGMHATARRSVRTSGIIIFRVADGRIAEYWGHYDRLGMQQQLQHG